MRERGTVWILVGDASRARIFALPERRGGRQHTLELVAEFDHPSSRAKVHDLVSDRQGRVQQSGGPSLAARGASYGNSGPGASYGNRAGMEPRTDPKTVEVEHFVHQLAAYLAKGLTGHSYHRLMLVASPAFLGMLREVLSAQVQKHVVASLDKDYTQLPVPELQERILAALPSA